MRWLSVVARLIVTLCSSLMARGQSGVPYDPRHNNSYEKRLMDFIVRDYDRDVRPVFNASDPVIIQLGITLTQIFDMDEKNQVLTTNVWLDQEWTDELLTWDPSQFGNMKELRVPCEKIWLPDIVLYNNADDYTRGYMNSKAMVHHNGRVFWPPPTKFRSTCAVDVTYFPFDDQTCILKLGSWTYNGFQVDVTNRTEQVDLTNYIPNGEWELLEARINRNVVYYSCCPEPFPDVTITLIIRRKTLFYMYNIVLPCMMMSVLTLLVFCMPPESGEKIGLGVTVLLAFSVFMLAIAEKMPETSDSVPLIGIYLTAVMAITSVSIIMTVVVLNLHYRGPGKKEVPHWMRRLVLGRTTSRRRRSESSSQKCAGCYRRRGFPGGDAHLADHPPLLPAYSPGNGTAFTAASAAYSKPEAVRLAVDTLPGAPPPAAEPAPASDASDSAGSPVALLADHTLFWVFLVITTVSSLLFLVVLPVYKRSQYQRPD
ncbi:neuronal acetylcholine receptor subunit alpha-10-like [Amphibalanus amphitrite]|uniref:neuronal acetylcholine receptor subunit alpha-10-like n=1 Tax=Amphibalanus amphitrite TaxID=1232801 RepID=UPI001C927BAB|nr:neuronal acetylcholine receptor subunit alpha-10-like [Amphibalanus amphitrite]